MLAAKLPQPAVDPSPACASLAQLRHTRPLLLRMWCHSAKQRGRRAPTQPASGQRLVAHQPANGRQLVADLLLAFEADRPRVASFPRARLPQSKALVQPSQLRPQAENVSATPSVEIAAALASTMAHRSKLLQPSAPRRPQADTKSVCGSQARATLGSSQCCNFHAANASATQLAPAAALG